MFGQNRTTFIVHRMFGLFRFHYLQSSCFKRIRHHVEEYHKERLRIDTCYILKFWIKNNGFEKKILEIHEAKNGDKRSPYLRRSKHLPKVMWPLDLYFITLCKIRHNVLCMRKHSLRDERTYKIAEKTTMNYISVLKMKNKTACVFEFIRERMGPTILTSVIIGGHYRHIDSSCA